MRELADHAVFLDFDGTLVDIADRPDGVQVTPGLTELLSSLSVRMEGALAIVTGRMVEDIDHYLQPLSLDVCGMHGLERRVGGTLSLPEGLVELGPQIEALRAAFSRRPGVLVEDKRVGVVLHWRLAPEAEEDAKAAMAELAAELGPGYRLQDGKAVRELVPAASGKGEAIRALMERAPYGGRVPVFVGDDRTDEHGFEAVNDLGGVSVKIGPGPTVANRRLPDATSFREWLRAWEAGREGVESLPLS